MSYARILSLALVAVLAGCTWAVDSKDELVRTGHSRSGEFAVNYQRLYRCFTTKVTVGGGGIFMGDGPIAQLYPDLKLAEYRLGGDKGWFMLIEFRGTAQNRTEVRAYDIRDGWLEDYWRDIGACAKDNAA